MFPVCLPCKADNNLASLKVLLSSHPLYSPRKQGGYLLSLCSCSHSCCGLSCLLSRCSLDCISLPCLPRHSHIPFHTLKIKDGIFPEMRVGRQTILGVVRIESELVTPHLKPAQPPGIQPELRQCRLINLDPRCIIGYHYHIGDIGLQTDR